MTYKVRMMSDQNVMGSFIKSTADAALFVALDHLLQVRMMLDQNVMGPLVNSSTFVGAAQTLIVAEKRCNEEDALAAARREERVGKPTYCVHAFLHVLLF